jgi:KipI family sensor histidine kinase inhibitor
VPDTLPLLHFTPVGPWAWRVGFATQIDEQAFLRGQALLADLEARPPAGLREVVPGYLSHLLEFAPAARPGLAALQAHLTDPGQMVPPNAGRTVVIPVVYDGPDLARVAAHTGLSERAVVELHTAGEYRVHLLGFAPGFAYLGGLDARLHTPRLATPRPRVPPGSVAIGGGQTAVYPLATPGGWNLLGRTERVMFDGGRSDLSAFTLHPGDRVRFQAVEAP